MSIDRVVCYFTLGVVTTIPIIFGAVHPIILAIYVFIILVGCGGGMLLTLSPDKISYPSFWVAVPLVLIGYIILQSTPLPMEIVDLLSAARSGRINMVNELAGTNISWTTLSDNGFTGWYRSFFFLCLLLYYFSLCRVLSTDSKFLSKLILCLVAVGTFEALYGILQFVKPQIGLLWLTLKTRAAHGTIIYKNQYASMLNMIWPLAITAGALYLFKKRSSIYPGHRGRAKGTIELLTTTKIQAPIYLFCAGSMILAVLFSLSRGGILSMVFVGILLTLILPFSRKSKMIFFCVFGSLLLGYVALLGTDTVVTRFGSIGRSGSGRLDIYLGSIPMLLENWITGIGVGSYKLLSPVYLKGFPAHVHFDRVHNEYLELMIELGIPFGTLLLFWLIVGILNLSIRFIYSVRSSSYSLESVAVSGAALCGLIGFLMHGLVDFGWRLPTNLLYAVTLLAIFTSSLSEPNAGHGGDK